MKREEQGEDPMTLSNFGISVLAVLIGGGVLTGCTNHVDDSFVIESTPSFTESTAEERNDTMPSMTIQIDNTRYPVTLYDNATVQALMDKLPLTIEMAELNGNEKYYYFSDALPSDARRVGSIKAGDVMLYGSDCLVIFYKGFATPYSYTPIGRIEDPAELAEALGADNVQVTFSH